MCSMLQFAARFTRQWHTAAVLLALGWPAVAGLALTQAIAAVPPTITQSSSLGVVPVTFLWACGEADQTAANQWFRRFDLAGEFGITTPVMVTAVDFGIERAWDVRRSQVAFVLVRSIPKGLPLTFENTTVLGDGNWVVDDQQLTLFHMPVSASFLHPLTEDLVIEVASETHPYTASGAFFIGCNTTFETRPSYWCAYHSGCDVDEPVTLASVRMGDQHVVMVVHLAEVPTAVRGLSWGRVKSLFR